MKGVNEVVRSRIRVSLFAYAYEIENKPLVSDSKYDSLCESLDTNTSTGNPRLDAFFRHRFSPETGMWVHQHPELELLKKLYNRIKGNWKNGK